MRFLILLVLLCGCTLPKTRYYNVTDSRGNEFTHLMKCESGSTYTVFTNDKGKIFVFKGNHSYIESDNCEKE